MNASALVIGFVSWLSVVGAADWDYRPLVAYADETVRAEWRPADASTEWKGAPGSQARIDIAGEVVRCDWIPAQDPVLALHGPNGAEARIQAVLPGSGSGLTWDAAGGLRHGTASALLALTRIEARSDRRWLLVRALSGDQAKPCAHHLGPEMVAEGLSPVLRQCVQAQELHPNGDGVLIELAAGERFVGWKHREFRQVLAWLVADLQARNAGFVVLVAPRAAAPVDDELEPLRAQVTDVANAYRCRVLDPRPLRDERYWTIAPNVLGTTLNAEGQAERGRQLAPWLGL